MQSHFAAIRTHSRMPEWAGEDRGETMNASRPDRRTPVATEPDPASISMVDVGGRRLALSYTGTGTPTVILETGLGAESSEWAAVQDAVQKLSGVCRYDRANRGASDPAPKPRGASEMLEDLRVLLRVAGLPKPYVLVGHSFGGLLMRLFAHRHPRDVHSLVLVDAMHEDQFEVYGSIFPPATPNDPTALHKVRAFWTGGWRKPESTAEGIDFVASLAQARTVDSLGDLRTYVLTAGTFANEPLVPLAYRHDLQRRWEDLQGRFLRLSSRPTQIFVRESGHFIQRDRPAAIVDAIARVLKSG